MTQKTLKINGSFEQMKDNIESIHEHTNKSTEKYMNEHLKKVLKS